MLFGVIDLVAELAHYVPRGQMQGQSVDKEPRWGSLSAKGAIDGFFQRRLLCKMAGSTLIIHRA